MHAYGVLWQDCTSKVPGIAQRRHRAWKLYGTTLTFIHKAVIAAAFGALAQQTASTLQVGLLVRCCAHVLTMMVTDPVPTVNALHMNGFRQLVGEQPPVEALRDVFAPPSQHVA